MWSIHCFQSWCAQKDLAIDFKSITKMELNQALRQFYATVKNRKDEPYGFSSYVGLHAGLNRYMATVLPNLAEELHCLAEE